MKAIFDQNLPVNWFEYVRSTTLTRFGEIRLTSHNLNSL